MQKKKSGVKKCLEIMTMRGEGGGGRRLGAKTILNFHFDYLNLRYIELSWTDDNFDMILPESVRGRVVSGSWTVPSGVRSPNHGCC